MKNLKDQIKKFILSTFPLARKKGIGFEDSLLESGIIDSLGILEIVNFLVEDLEVEIDEDDLVPDNFNTIIDMVKLIEKRTA